MVYNTSIFEKLHFSSPKPCTQTTCSFKMPGLCANFTKIRNFCLKMSSNRLILIKNRSLLEFDDFGFNMAIHCHPYIQYEVTFNALSCLRWGKKTHLTFFDRKLWNCWRHKSHPFYLVLLIFLSLASPISKNTRL